MTLADLTPEKIAEFEAIRKTKALATQTMLEAASAERRQLRAEINAGIHAKRNKLHTVKTTPHTCHVCGETISIGEKYTVEAVPFGTVYREATISQYTCIKCATEPGK